MSSICVPTIDISPILKPEPLNWESDEIKELIHQISKACKEWGFFYIINCKVEVQLIEKVVKESMKFFRLPKDIKNKVARFEGNFQGFSDSELTKQKQDWKQIFDYTGEDEDPDILDGDKIARIHGKNLWPSEELLPDFRRTILIYFHKMRSLGLLLMKAVFLGLSLPPEDVDQFILDSFKGGQEDTSFARLNYYPIYPGGEVSPEIQLGVGPHSDAGVLTILFQQEGITSLQVKKDEKFWNVPPIKDSFVINIGDMTQIWSNDLYKAPVHRVLANPNMERFSLPYFLNPSYSCDVEPLDLKNDTVKLYRKVKWGEFRRGRVLGDYADYGEELQISHYKI